MVESVLSPTSAPPASAKPFLIDKTDGELMRAYAETGSDAAFRVLVERHGPAVFAAARRHLDDSDADDVTQAVFLLLMRKRKSIGRPERVAGWLINTTYYCVRTARRSSARRAKYEQAAARELQARSAVEAGAPMETLEQIDAAISRLGSVDRAVITLAYLEQQHPEQVAATLRMALPAVRKRMSRALVKLRETLTTMNVVVSAEVLESALTVSPPVPASGLFDRIRTADATHGPAIQIANATARRVWTLPRLALAAATTVVLAGGVLTSVWIWSGNGANPVVSPTKLPPRTEYVSDFSKDTADWSRRSVSRTPNGNRPFLGPFGSDTVQLRLDRLALHRFVRIRAELFIMRTWDGPARLDINKAVAGLDMLTLSLEGGATLLRGTFSATPDENFATIGKTQTYPAPIPSRPRIAGTGAVETNTLGYIASFWNGRYSFPMDGVYKLDMTVPHTADTLTLVAQGSGLAGIDDESWGLANVKVEALADAPAAPTETQCEYWLADVTGNDPVAANRGFWKLVAGSDTTVEFLNRQKIPPGFNTADVERRLAMLNGPARDAAAEAMLDLTAMGPGIETLIKGQPDQRRILENIELRPIEGLPARQAAAKARLLATIDTPAAKSTLKTWLDNGSPWQPDLLRKFETEHRLPDDAILTYVPKPDAEARAEYVSRRAALLRYVQLKQTHDFAAPPPSEDVKSLVFTTNDPAPTFYTPMEVLFTVTRPTLQSTNVTDPGISQVAAALGRARSYGSLGTWRRVVVPPELRNVRLPGDWVIRCQARPAELLGQFIDILTAETGQQITAQSSTMVLASSTLTGTFAYTPAVPSAPQPAVERSPEREEEPAVSDGREPIPVIDLYTDVADLAAAPVKRDIVTARPVQLSYLSYIVSRLYQRRLTLADDSTQVIVRLHPDAARVVDRDDADLSANRQRAEQVLKNIAAQTGLTLDTQETTEPVERLVVGP